MTHDQVISALPAATRAALHERSDAAGFAHLAGHLGAIALTGTWISLGAPLWWAVLPVHGVLLVFLFTLQHECTHRTPFRSGWLNEIMGHATGLVIFQPFTWFRYFHLAHHRHTNDPAQDPELLAGGRPETRWAWAWHVSGLPTWAASARLFGRLTARSIAEDYLPRRALARVRLEARAMLVGYALVLGLFGPALIWLWLLPLLLGQPVLRLFLLAEHGRCPPVANMLENTRTTFTTRAIRFLAWNMPFHIEHHSAPNVPFHRLPALHREMRAHLVTTAAGYAAFTRDYVAALEG